MRCLADEQGDARPHRRGRQLPAQIEPVREIRDGRAQLGAGERKAAEIPDQAHEEETVLPVDVLVGVHDVAMVAEQEVG
jgi:hypothetical protein